MPTRRSAVSVLIWLAAAVCLAAAGVIYAKTSGGATVGSGQTRPAEISTGHREYEAFRAQVRGQLLAGEFEALERTAKTLAERKERFAGGDWKLFRFFQGLAKPEQADLATEAEWQRHKDAVERWASARPASTAARIALGQTLVEYAWKARGKGFANTVPEEGWDAFRERLAAGRGVLTAVQSAPDRGPHWYSVMQTIALGQGWERADYDALFGEAVRVEPRYEHFYSAKARYLLPRWYGRSGEWERFADESAAAIGDQEGSALYAHVAWEMSRHFLVADFFDRNRVSWPRIRQGYVDREALYGETVRHLNELCLLAGGARDKETVRATMGRIGDRWDEDVWKEKKHFDAFRRWSR